MKTLELIVYDGELYLNNTQQLRSVNGCAIEGHKEIIPIKGWDGKEVVRLSAVSITGENLQFELGVGRSMASLEAQ